jgi:hypothetical protein
MTNLTTRDANISINISRLFIPSISVFNGILHKVKIRSPIVAFCFQMRELFAEVACLFYIRASEI